MIAHIKKLLESSQAFVVHIQINGGPDYQNRGVYSVDNVGIAIEGPRSLDPDICIPWTSIQTLLVEEI
jgi:hypothetical protein